MKIFQKNRANIKKSVQPKSDRIKTISVIAICPIWGLVSSALLLNLDLSHSQLVNSIIGILFAGLLPVTVHIYEALVGKECFEWKIIFASISLGGIFILFLGSILQNLLLICGICNLLGIRIDTWSWMFPMQNSY
jgi:hypothetical protein